jgi:geranylgeranyl reductase family protein
MRVDVAVVGAGPAGAAAALRARQLAPDASVLVLDKAVFPRDKACGDGIAAHVVDELARIGARGVVDGYPCVSWLRISLPDGTQMTAPPPRANFVVPREVFDARLVDAARTAGARVERMTVRRVEDRGGSVVLNDEVAAHVVVAADGANSRVRRLLGAAPNPPGALALALRGYGPAPPGRAEQLIALVADDWPAYAWSFPIGDGSANVGFGMLRDRLVRGRVDLAERLAAALPCQPPEPATLRAHHLPLSTHRPAPAQGRVLLAGDAASLINPLTGEGIFYAVLSGALAGAAAVRCPHAPATAYTALLRRRLGRHLRHAGLLARAGRYPPFVSWVLREASRSPRLWESLLELGLGEGTVTTVVVRDLARGLRRTR